MPTEIDGSIYYSGKDVAEACGVSRQTIWRWRQEGTIPSGRPHRSGAVVFTEAEVEYIRARASHVGPAGSEEAHEIYLDNAASTRPLAIVRDAVARAMGADFGNPSSAHGSGRRARQALEDARDQVAALVGADRSAVVFTSGGTEANNLVLRNADRAGFRRVVTTAVEHSSVLGVLDSLANSGVDVVRVPVGACGRISMQALGRIAIDDHTLVSIQWANNETGVLQPVAEIASHVSARRGFFHTDAAQAVGKLPIEFASLPIDALTFTAHKLHGPQGVGALIARQPSRINSLLLGGTQERGLRAGTENYPGIIGFGVAAEHRNATLRTFVRHSRALRDMFESRLRQEVPGIRINCDSSDRVCTTGSATISGVDGQALVAQLDARGIRISQSSACTNMRPEPSYVLRAMGHTEEQAYSTFRYAMSEDTTLAGCAKAADAIVEIAARLSAKPVLRNPAAKHQEVA